MIQGKTKIQLFDSNGNLENEIVEKNMVTNALKYLVSLDSSMLFNNTAASIFESSMPFYSKAMSGLMLFNENIEENPEIIFKPANVNIVGHAGSAYSGTNVMRGTYNSNESGELKDDNLQVIGYRRVWDFGTDKANGTIKCLSLTSLDGGNNAFRPAIYSDSSKGHNHTRYGTAGISISGRYLGLVSKGTIARLWYGSRAGITGFWLDHYQICPKNNITIFEDHNAKRSFSKCLEITTTLPSNVDALYALAPDENGYAYLCKVDSSGIVTYSKFSIISGEVEEGTIAVDLPDGYTLYTPNCIMWGNRIVLMVKNTSDGKNYIVIFDIQGKFINMYSSSFNKLVYAGVEDSRLYVADSYSRFVVMENDVISGGIGLIEGGWSNYYWGTTQYKYKNAIYYITENNYISNTEGRALCVARRDDFISTINNLSTPVVKTNAQTMKITYDITME